MPIIFTVLLLVLCPLLASAQSVPANQPFNVAFDDTQVVVGYRCYVDGVKTGPDLSVTNKVCAIPGQATGIHKIEVTAFNALAESGKSAPLSVTSGTAPTPPTNLRIVVQV